MIVCDHHNVVNNCDFVLEQTVMKSRLLAVELKIVSNTLIEQSCGSPQLFSLPLSRICNSLDVLMHKLWTLVWLHAVL